MKRKKVISITEFYYFYPYKKNTHKGNTVCQPYIKQEDEVTDHKYSIEYSVWKSVVDTYIECIRNELLKGDTHYFHNSLGYLQLRKYKSKKQIDYNTWAKTGIKTYYKNIDDYTVILKWYRTYKTTKLKHKYFWKVKMVVSLTKPLQKMLTTNLNNIYNILDT
jgi:hypothetical protein